MDKNLLLFKGDAILSNIFRPKEADLGSNLLSYAIARQDIF